MKSKVYIEKDKDMKECLGGVVLVSSNLRTCCKNTLDVRIE